MEQQIDQNLLEELISFGFEENAVKKALALTKDKEQAVELILSFQEDEANGNVQQENYVPQQLDIQHANLLGNFNPQQLLNMANQNLQFAQQLPERQYKMVFLVRADLKMGIGKIAAQVGHSVLGAYHRICDLIKNEKDGKYAKALESWEIYGQPKIVLKVETKQEFEELDRKAQEIGLNTYVVQDAGRTQIEPGSTTVCAIGPGPIEEIDSITKHLKLY